MRRRRFLAAAAATAAGACATACSGDGGHDDGRVRLDYLSLAWQRESVAANKALVREWNAAHPRVRVRYVQGSWDTVHDQLLTSFEGGSPPDVIHDEAGDLTDFAHGGFLTDLTGLLPGSLEAQIPERSWSTARIDGGLYGVPFLQEPRVLIANRTLLDDAGIRLPTPGEPWSWAEFEEAARELTGGRRAGGGRARYGVAWSMKEPVSQSVNLSRLTGGRVLHREDGRNVIRFDDRDSAFARLVRRQTHTDRTAAASTISMSGSDTLPGFFAGRYAMLPLPFSFRQQVRQQQPDGFSWVTLPLPAGDPAHGGGSQQGTSPQTLSVARDSRHRRAAAEFIAFLTRPRALVRLARGDWLLPTGTEALADPALDTPEHGWRTGVATAPDLVASPALGVRGYPEWSDKVATPAFQQYYSGSTGLAELRRSLVEDGNRVLARYQR
jgi:ABC-type glycerol-3-phosphate transport system substrate-binding protein